MKIYILPMKQEIECFGVVWTQDSTSFIGLPKNHGGLMLFPSDEVEVIDPSFQFPITYYKNDFAQFVCHSFLIKNQLLDAVIEHDEDSYRKFLDFIKAEKIVEPNFY